MKHPTLISRSPLLSLTRTSLLLSTLLAFTPGCEGAAKGGPPLATEAPVAVEKHTVASAQSPVLLRLTGSLRGARETELAANVAGRILNTGIERGDTVQAGTLLAQVDTKAAQLALAEARVSVQTSRTQQEISQKDCERYEKLKATGVVTDQEYDQVTAKCKTAPLSVNAAEAHEMLAAKNVGDGAIRSPFAGVITERYIEVGEYVQASSAVVSIAQVDTLKLIFSVPEKNYPNVRPDSIAHFNVAAYGDSRFEARIAHISGAVTKTRDVVVEALVANADHRLLPGMFSEIELNVGEESLPAVPRAATFEKNGKLNVMVVSNGMLEQRIVQIGPALGELLPIRRGLAIGEVIVKTADLKLKNGQKVL
jgi:membrane fusion protein, multidrug efflux system